MKATYWIFGVLGGIFILFLLFAPTTKEAAINSTPKANELQNSILESDIDLSAKPPLYIGDPDAPATLVEYGDFKCPSCNSFHHNAGAELRKEYVEDGRLKIEFRNFPFIGPDSGRAARGTYCANDQDKFAEFHDLVYNYMWDNYYGSGDYSSEFTDILTLDVIQEIMAGVISDISSFRECLESTTFNGSVDTDLGLATGDGITGTPGFVVGGRRVTGPSNFNTFKTLIDIQLKR